MSLEDKRMDRTPRESSHTRETPGDKKHTHRLYPSLPSVNRYEFFMPRRFAGDNLAEAALHHSESLPGDAQVEGSAAKTDIRMTAQMLILEEQKQELLSINEKWAKEYRIMEQYYQQKVRNLKELLPQEQSHFKKEACGEGEKPVTPCKTLEPETVKDKDDAQAGDGDVSPEFIKAEPDAKELQAQNRTLTQRGKHQHEEIRRLNKALEDALQTSQPVETNSETLQDVWKHQAEVYKEDFQKERKDREKLKEKYLELEKKFRKLRNELHVLKSQATWTSSPRPLLECTCAKREKCPNYDGRPANQHCNHFQRHHTEKP